MLQDTSYITGHPDYELAGIYADEGISGTNTKKREQFNKMIGDCKAGKIDMIITKSISRFARNTLDCLNYVRLLKDLGVGIIFEKENINSLDSKGEVLLTILSSLAQDESRSISENCTWGIRRRFEQGKIIVNQIKFLGYDKDDKGNLIINKEQAEIVRRIYTEFLEGKGANRIAKDLEEDRVLTWDGKTTCYHGTIRRILSNEKYKGDALLQKTYTVDFLNKKRAENEGQVPQHYVEDSHPAIIDKDTWATVQLEMERRKAFAEEYGIGLIDYSTANKPFSGKVICGKCGKAYGRKVWNSTDEKLRRVIWRCNSKYAVKGEKGCESRHIDEKVLYEGFINTFNAVIGNIDYFMGKWRSMQSGEDILMSVTAKRFIQIFSKAAPIEHFDVDLYFKLVEKITVYDGGGLVFSLLDGSKVECGIE
jgi:site-specific DNA recombinase